MVFLSLTSLIRARGPDEFWRKRKIFRLAAHYIGRKRNCYSLAIKAVHRALVFATKGRRQRREDFRELWDARIAGAAGMHNLAHMQMREGLERAGVQLDRKTLANLAVYEPRSFAGLSAIAKEVCIVEGIEAAVKETPTGTDLRYRLFKRNTKNET